MRRSAILILVIVSCLSIVNTVRSQLILTKEQAIEDFKWLRYSLEYVHPRLYKYDGQQSVGARFDSLSSRIVNDMPGVDFLALVGNTNAAVRCGHLYTIPQDQLQKEIVSKKVLPFHIRILSNKLYIFNDCSNYLIRSGSQIVAINGRSGKQIIDAMLPGVAADGYIETRKLRLMERYFNFPFQGFDLYYYLHVDRSEDFTVEYIEYGTKKKKSVSLKGISHEERQKLLLEKYNVDEQAWFKAPSPKFETDKNSKYAVLTVSRSFYDKNIDPDFDSLLNSAFDKIKKAEIKNLIVDLRNNEGGDEQQQMELMSYLYNKPFKLYQNIYLSHLDFSPLKKIIVERDTANLVFNNDDGYMRRVKDNLWINNYEYSDNLKLHPAKENAFTGKLYVLINGASFSSAADLIADLRRTTNAVFIGEESGGTFEGPTGGDNIVVQLPNSRIMVRISPNIHIGYMPRQHPPGRGVIPTYPIKYSVKDIVERRDLELEFAKKLIK